MPANNAPMFLGNQLAAAVYLGTRRLWVRPETLSLDFAADQYKMGGIAELPATRQFSDIITFTRASGGGRFNAQGQYEWLPADQPRFDYDPVTGEAKGLLIEEQRSNKALHSEDFANPVWVKSSVEVSVNAEASPRGLIDADVLTASVVGGTVIQTLSSTAGNAGSFYIKKIHGSSSSVEITLNGVTWIPVVLANSWARYHVVQSGTSFGIRIPESGMSIAVWGAQAE